MSLTVTATNKGQTPNGQYLFELDHCEEAVGKDFKTGQPVDQIKWVWVIRRVLELEPDAEQEAAVGTEYWEWSGTTASPRSKLRARVQALLGRPMEDREAIDIPALYGRRVKTTIGEYVKTDGSTGVGIVAMSAYAAGKPKPPAASARPAAEMADFVNDQGKDDLPF